MNVENVVAEQWVLLRVSVMLSQDLIKQPLALEQVVRAAGQTSADLNHQLVGQELETVHRPRHPLISPDRERHTVRQGRVLRATEIQGGSDEPSIFSDLENLRELDCFQSQFNCFVFMFVTCSVISGKRHISS